MNKILIVGGGTAGLISALILKTKFPEKTVDMIASKQIGTIGVGEGSTEHWNEFMQFVGLDKFTVIKETDSALKFGVKFENWSEKTFYHCVQDPYNIKFGQYRALYGKLIGENADPSEFISKITLRDEINEYFYNNIDNFPCNQFNFNTFKLIDYLTKVATSRGIKVFDDVIKEVSQNDNGNISKLIGQEANYTYDFYIDCTGFRRVLIGKLGSKWISHSKYLKMKSAMVFPTKDTESIPLWITARAMDYGWFFKTPIYNRYGNGYIYDSDYVSSDDAKLEIDRLMGYEVEIAQHIKFDPGCLDKVWIKNCCAIGLSGSFVEPLEASSIGSTIHQTFLLMHRLENYSQRTIDSYNVSFHSIIENIRDYIIIHYLTKKTNTEFWQDCARIELPESLGNKLALWKEHLPIQEDLSLSSNYILYNDQNHILILAGLDYFNRESILQEYKSCSYRLHYEVDQILKTRHFHDQTDKSVSHRQFIERIRKVSLQ